MVINKAEGCLYLKMGLITRDNSKITRSMAEASYTTVKENQHMTECGFMVNSMVVALFTTRLLKHSSIIPSTARISIKWKITGWHIQVRMCIFR